MAPIKDEEAYGRVVDKIINSKVAIGAILYALGGGTFTLMDRLVPEKPNPQMEAIFAAAQQVPVIQDSIAQHSKAIREVRGDVSDLDQRVAYLIEPDNSRSLYGRPRGIGRHRE